MVTVLVTGATGFIGRRLVPALLDAGHDVRAMTRRPESYDGPGEPVGADVSDRASLDEALRDVDVAIYLVHSLDDPDFERKDAEAARTFSAAAAAAGVKQIVYMGGLGDDDDDLSAHLRSRREVEGLLGGDGVPVTVLRAAIVVGHGGISWEITRQLVKNLPAMVVPKWVGTRTQPIAIDDVVRYLAGVVDHPDAAGPGLRDRRARAADLPRDDAGRRRGDATAGRSRSSSSRCSRPGCRRTGWRWSPTSTSRPGATSSTRCPPRSSSRDTSIRDVVPGEPLTYRESVRRALAERAASSAGQKSRGSRNSIDSDHVMWVRIGARMPPLARRSRPQTVPSRIGGEGEHDVAGRERRDDVGERRPEHRVARDRGVHRAAEEELLGDAVDEGDGREQRQRALVGVLQHAADVVGQRVDLAHDEGAEDEDPDEEQAEHDRRQDRPDEDLAARRRCARGGGGPDRKAPAAQTPASTTAAT